MKVDFNNVNFEELARCTEDFNGAQMKAVAVESGMYYVIVMILMTMIIMMFMMVLMIIKNNM